MYILQFSTIKLNALISDNNCIKLKFISTNKYFYNIFIFGEHN